MPPPNSPGAEFSVKLFDYVCGSSKASIDTNVDGPTPGLFPTEFSLLEIFIYARTDEASVRSVITTRCNNDSGSNYDLHDIYAINTTTATDGPTLAATSWGINVNGASAAANFFSAGCIQIPGYGDSVGYKRCNFQQALGDSTAANVISGIFTLGYRSTSPITRLSFAPATGGKSFVAGSRIVVYGR